MRENRPGGVAAAFIRTSLGAFATRRGCGHREGAERNAGAALPLAQPDVWAAGLSLGERFTPCPLSAASLTNPDREPDRLAFSLSRAPVQPLCVPLPLCLLRITPGYTGSSSSKPSLTTIVDKRYIPPPPLRHSRSPARICETLHTNECVMVVAKPMPCSISLDIQKYSVIYCISSSSLALTLCSERFPWPEAL